MPYLNPFKRPTNENAESSWLASHFVGALVTTIGAAAFALGYWLAGK